LYVIEKRALEPFRAAGATISASSHHFETKSGTRGTRPSRGAPPIDFGKDLFPALLKQGARLFGYNSPEFIKDIGTPQRYDHVCAQFAAGIVQRSTLAMPQRAVFLDRDGTLVRGQFAGLRSTEELALLREWPKPLELNHAACAW
jgi:hypothetical protein